MLSKKLKLLSDENITPGRKMRSIQTFSWKKQYLAEKDLITFNHEALNRNFSKELEQLGITMSEIDY